MDQHLIQHIVAADWSRDPEKRAVCHADVGLRHVTLLDMPHPTLERLVDWCDKHATGQKLLSFDLALGIPVDFHGQLADSGRISRDTSFIEWLSGQKLDSEFWSETNIASEWSIDRPFIAVPPGKGSLTRFRERANHDLLRAIDRQCGGKSAFIVSGIPGTVGSGTRCFWQELIPLLRSQRGIAVWPFHGQLAELLVKHDLVVGENYPAISYGIVLSDTLPAKQIRLAKTKIATRIEVSRRLNQVAWIVSHNVQLPQLEPCETSEDLFDALMAALAQLRLALEGELLSRDGLIDPLAEGGILGSFAVSPG